MVNQDRADSRAGEAGIYTIIDGSIRHGMR